MKWLIWCKFRISFFLFEDCIEIESGLMMCGIKGNLMMVWVWINLVIVDFMKEVLLRVDWLLEKCVW